MKETEVQAGICEYLSLRKLFFVRLNNTPSVYRDKTNQLRFRKLGKYALPGLSDILVVKNGMAIFLEVKQEKGKQSEGQKDFEWGAISAGADYHVVRSIDEVKALGL